MDIKFSVILYSKYSKFSKSLIETIEKSNVDFINQFQLKLLCIDNEAVRKRILNNKQIDIKTVPCILIVYNDGGVEKYEDTKAFEWVEQIIRQLAPPPLPVQIHQPILEEDIQVIQNDENEDINDVSVQQEKAIKRQQNKMQKKQTQQQKIKSQQSQQQQIQNNQLRKQKASNIAVNTNPSVPQSQNTSIDDLLLDDEGQEDFDVMNEDEVDMYINEDPPTLNQVESTNALSVKRNDLMSLASSMQKSRDTFVGKTEKPKFNTLM
jgi:hypothetical protein